MESEAPSALDTALATCLAHVQTLVRNAPRLHAQDVHDAATFVLAATEQLPATHPVLPLLFALERLADEIAVGRGLPGIALMPIAAALETAQLCVKQPNQTLPAALTRAVAAAHFEIDTLLPVQPRRGQSVAKPAGPANLVTLRTARPPQSLDARIAAVRDARHARHSAHPARRAYHPEPALPATLTAG